MAAIADAIALLIENGYRIEPNVHLSRCPNLCIYKATTQGGVFVAEYRAAEGPASHAPNQLATASAMRAAVIFRKLERDYQ